MLIGIDGNEANYRNRVGIGQYAFSVIYQLEKIDKENKYLIYLKEPLAEDLPKEGKGWNYRIFGPSKLWTQIALPIKLFTQKEKLDIFYTPSHYSPRFSPIPTIMTITDLWHHRHPEQFTKKDLYQLSKWESYSIRKARHIITISEFSKKEIMDIYKLPEEKVTVAYPGFTRYKDTKIQRYKVEQVKKKYEIKDDYLLYLGTLQPKKNIEGLIKAFGFLVFNIQYPISNISLIIAGKKGWMYDKIFRLVEELNLQDKVIFTGFIEEEEKPYLIAGSKAFVFPSFYEGFGIPVLEAMSLGVPVVCSKSGSLPEVGGRAAIYCDPYSVEDISRAMNKVLSLNQRQKDEIIKAGLEQSEKFSWEKCSNTILGVLQDEGKN